METNNIQEPAISNEMTRYWKTKLQALKNSCGCETGAVALLLSLAVSLFYFFYHSGILYSSGKKLGYILLICFGSAVAGKLIGIGWSRLKYYRLRKKLREDFPAVFNNYSKP